MFGSTRATPEGRPVGRSQRDYVLIGLMGQGIEQSLSPLLHQREADRQGIRLIYTLIDTHRLSLQASDIPQVLRWAHLLGYRGLNVTYPFKQAIVQYLDDLSHEARTIGAVNTVVIDEAGKTRGFNTDASGFRQGFELRFADAPRRNVVQLGAGGAGAAVAHAMLSLGTDRLTLIDLDEEKARKLAAALAPAFGHERVHVSKGGEITGALSSADGLINTTPIGMHQHPGTPVAVSLLRPDLWVADVVYRPTETELLRAAQAVGAPTLNGGGMATFQAVAAFEHFTGMAANADAMLADFADLLAAGL